MGYAEDPGRKRATVIKFVEFSVSFKQRILHHVFSIQHRAGHARAVTVQAWPELTNGLKKRKISRLEPAGWTDIVLHIDIYAPRPLQDTRQSSILIRKLANNATSFQNSQWPQTVNELLPLVSDRAPSEHVFLNRRGEPLTRFGIHTMVERHAQKVAQHMPSVATKRVSPHTIRRTTATHLLRAGVDINTIRAWLGHVSLSTTKIYAEVDLEMKAKALAACEVAETKPAKRWSQDQDLMAFLRSL